MIFNLVKASAIIKKSSRLLLGWLFKPRQAVKDGQHSQGSTAGGMFGLLVAGDDAHRR